MFNPQRLAKILKFLVYAAAFMPLVIFSQFMSPFHFGKVVVFRLIVTAMVVFYAVLVLKDRSYWPRPTKLLWSVTIFTAAFGVSTLTSAIPYNSFWGTLERMGGWFSFLHFWAFFVISTAVLKEKEEWLTFIKLSLAASLLSAFYGFLQKTDLKWIIGSGGRQKIFGTIGNPALFAGYMIVNVFLALMLFFRKSTSAIWHRFSLLVFLVGALAVFLTGVRGSALALITGVILFGFMYAMTFGSVRARKLTMSLAALIFLIAGALYLSRDTDFVKKNQYLSRYSDFSPTAYTVKTRFWAWRAGFDGFNDSLKNLAVGPGPENFNLPFSKHFYPKFFRGLGSETLFDRAHNQFLEILFTMGIVGFVPYILIFIFAFRDLKPAELPRALDRGETGVLRLGLMATLVAYMIHNFFIFDTAANYLMFFMVLGLISNLNQTKLAEKNSRSKPGRSSSLGGRSVLAGLVGAVLAVAGAILVYYTDIKPSRANYATTRAIVASWNSQHDLSFEKYKIALKYNTFGKYEIRHRYAQYVLERYNSRKLDDEAVERLLTAIQYVQKNAGEFPGDYLPYLYLSRSYILLGRADRNSPYNDLALENSIRAIELSPTFIRSHYEAAQAYLNKKDYTEAIKHFKKALELNPDVPLSWWYLGVSQFESGDRDGGVETILAALNKGFEFDQNEADLIRLINVFLHSKDYRRIAGYYEKLIKLQPRDAQYHASLATTYIQLGNIDGAVSEAKAAAEIDPSFEAEARAFVKSLGRSWPR